MSKRILIVDDDPMMRSLVRTVLEASEFTVIEASDGTDAVTILEEQPRPIDLYCMILDVEMPNMNGLDLLTRLKLHSDTQNIPVIMLTSNSDPEDLMEGYNVGAEYYITKPFTKDQLLYGIELVTA